MSVLETDFILHQYEMSPFSEKIRKIFAHKNAKWYAVEQPNIAPKPNLTPLTGGYRRIPVMQIGAHVYCDTKLIVREIEARMPVPVLTPPALVGIAEIIADWSDHRLFTQVAGPTIMEMISLLPPEFMEDRAAMSEGFTSQNIVEAAPFMREQFMQVCSRLNKQLAHTQFLLGDVFTLADAAVFHIINFTSLGPIQNSIVEQYESLMLWRTQVREMGQGQRYDLDPQAALDLAKSLTPDMTPPHDSVETINGHSIGQMVRVQADDYGRETTDGVIAWQREDEVAIIRDDPQLGQLLIHYPRAGYRITKI